MPKWKKREKSNSNNNKTKSISRLIQARKWLSVKEKLAEVDFFGPTIAEFSASTSNDTETPLSCMGLTEAGVDIDGVHKKNNETVLHTSCRHQPPLEIIELIIDKFPEAVCAKTLKEKQYPLHVAAANGAHPEVISLLILKNPSAASSSDYYGRTPLHLACESYFITFKEEKEPNLGGKATGSAEENFQKQQPLDVETAMLQTVRAMTKNFPEIVNIHDNEDMTALEYAICSNIPLPIVQSIQRASERFFKLQKEKSLNSLRASIVEETQPSSNSKESSDEDANKDEREQKVQISNDLPTTSDGLSN